MIQYKGFYLDLETDEDKVYYVVSDTSDQKQKVWKLSSTITLEKALELVNKDIEEDKTFKVHTAAVDELNKIYPNSWKYCFDDNGELVILFEDKPIHYPLRFSEKSTVETAVKYLKFAATKTVKK